MATTSLPDSSKRPSREALGLLLVLAAFAAISLATGDRSPIPTHDEAMFTDPAANLYFNGSFTSTACFTQDYKSFVIHFGPVHPFLLYAWMCMFGFSVLAVRSFAFALMIGAAVLVWLFVKRQSLVANGAWRVVMVVLILAGFGTVHSYRMARPDALAMFLAAAAAAAATIGPLRYRLPAIAAVAALMLPSYPALPLYAAILSFIVLAYDRARWREVAAGAVGILLGGLALYFFYRWNGAWDRYLQMGMHETATRAKLREQLGGIVKDPSIMAVVLMLAGLALRQVRRREFSWRSPTAFGLIAAAGIIIPLALLGHYPAYYSWMAYIPCVICLCAALERAWPDLRSWYGRSVLVGGLAIAAAGLPVFVGFALVDWNDRDPARVQALADRNVSATDWVWCHNAAYYAVRRRTRMAFCGMYQLNDEERRRITVVIDTPPTPPEDSAKRSLLLDDLAERYGGKWRDTGDEVLSSNGATRLVKSSSYIFRLYYLRVYRRVEPGGADEHSLGGHPGSAAAAGDFQGVRG